VPDESRRCASLAGDHPPASAAPTLPAQASLFREAEQAVAPAGGGRMAAPSHLEAPGQQGGKRRREEGNAGEAMEASMPHASRQGVVAMPEGLMGETVLEGEPPAPQCRGSKRARRSVQPGSANSPYPESTNRPCPKSTNRPYPESTNRPYPESTNRPYPESTNRPHPESSSERPARPSSSLERRATSRGYDALLALPSLVRRHSSMRKPTRLAWQKGRRRSSG